MTAAGARGWLTVHDTVLPSGGDRAAIPKGSKIQAPVPEGGLEQHLLPAVTSTVLA